MAQEAYVSFEIAKLLKEKGFDWDCNAIYGRKGEFQRNTDRAFNNGGLHVTSAPTHQMACAWLREKHHIHANPIRQGNYNDYSDYYTWIVASNGTIHRNQSVADKLSYEEAVESALKYTLENLI